MRGMFFFFQSMRHHIHRWGGVVLLVCVCIFPVVLWTFLEVHKPHTPSSHLSFLGKPVTDIWILEAVREGIAPAPPHPIWREADIRWQIKLLWALILWPVVMWLFLLWTAETTTHLAAVWLHRDIAGYFFCNADFSPTMVRCDAVGSCVFGGGVCWVFALLFFVGFVC
jgi:hypothetical protein